MKSTAVIITLVSMVTTWYPVATETLTPINPDNLNPGAAHVCQVTEKESYTERVSYKQYFTQKTNTWCWAVPPRCTEYRIAARTAYKEETRYRDRTRYFCCKGYKSLLGNNYCVPHCQHDCYADKSQGYCVTPGMCKCKPGFKGQYCESGCASNQWGPDCSNTCQCGTHGACEPTNGNCVCHIGWIGNDCSQKCYNSFGLNCVHPCVCQNGATCDNVNGKCTCMTGFYGAYCHLKCTPSSTGEEGCEQTCPCQNEGECTATGACICKKGFKGEFCTESCDTYHWGINCTNKCNCNFGTCNKKDGECNCNLGYAGKSCQIKCREGFYGIGCLTQCGCKNGGKCYRDQSTQLTMCDCAGTGFHGDTCSTRDCVEDKFLVPGTTDTCQNCTCDWNSANSCHPWTGTCSCKPGYTGNQCKENCKMPFYGQGCSTVCSCANGDCDHVTGECTTCYPGYIGKECDTPCSDGFWGPKCFNKCLCKNGAICHVKTGYCECQPGFFGQFCGDYCPQDKYGPGCKLDCNCDKQKSTCSPHTGQCLCNPGYTGSDCQDTCVAGKYGHFCRQICHCDPQGTSSCDSVTGFCNCKGGWSGKKCDIICAENNWGPNCVKKCNCNGNGQCHGETGACVCFNGYQGDRCERDDNGIVVQAQQTGGDTESTATSSTTPLIIAVVIPCVILLLIIALVVMYYMRQVRRLKDENIRVRYEANGALPGETAIPNGHAGIGVINPTYDDDNARNERRYPHLSQRASAAPPPLPHRQQSCDACDDIDVEKLRVTLDDRRSRPVSSQYADIDDMEDRYTTLKSVSGATNPLAKENGTLQFTPEKGDIEGQLSRSSSRSSDVSGEFTNKGYANYT